MNENDTYNNFLIFKNNYNLDENSVEHMWVELTKKERELSLLNKFICYMYRGRNPLDFIQLSPDDDDYDDYDLFDKNYCDLSFCILYSFPKEYTLKLLKKNFKGRSICYYDSLHRDLVKYTYKIWNIYVDDEISEMIDKISKHLIEVANMKKEEYNDIMHNPNNPRYNSAKHYIYYTFWLYAYFPLLKNCEELILKLIEIAYLDDAQDELLFGLYQMEPQKLAP